MVIKLNDNELLLVEILYPVPNYPEVQKELWQKIRQHSTVSLKALDRIESMLPGGEFYNQYQEYACHGAAFYAMGVVFSPFEVNQEDNKRIIDANLVKVEKTTQSELTLLCFFEKRQSPNPEFHFAVDLGLDANERIAFHKSGWGNPSWITYTSNIFDLYHDFRSEYWVWPERSERTK